jgi:dihydroxyacid dehydratase/phosphogluconate dehydratase
MEKLDNRNNRSFNVFSDAIARNGTIMKFSYSSIKQEEIKKSGRVFDSSEQIRAKSIIENTKTRFNNV